MVSCLNIFSFNVYNDPISNTPLSLFYRKENCDSEKFPKLFEATQLAQGEIGMQNPDTEKSTLLASWLHLLYVWIQGVCIEQKKQKGKKKIHLLIKTLGFRGETTLL